MTTYIPNRTSDPVAPDGWETGRTKFDALVGAITRRGWAIEHDANMSFYGAYWIVTPFGEFIGHGFGRADSLHIAYHAALLKQESKGTQ